MASTTLHKPLRLAEPSSHCGVPTATKTHFAEATACLHSVVKVSRPAFAFRKTSSDRPGS